MKHEERFARALTAVSRRVAKLRATEICCGGLTREQFDTLRAIEAAREPSITALSDSLRVDLSTMSRNVTVLEREKYVSRERAADDSRKVTVILTPKGRGALETLCCDEEDVMARVFHHLPASQRPTVVDALETLHAVLDALDAAKDTTNDAGLVQVGLKRVAR